MLHKVVEIDKFEGYQVSRDMYVRLPPFANDTMILGNGRWNNLWSIKAILEDFELVLGFKVNFYKSEIYGVNVDEAFMKCASQFLCCCKDDIPFKFLGIPLGANPIRRVTCNLVLESLKKKLPTWKAQMLSFGGRVILLNSRLSSILVVRGFSPQNCFPILYRRSKKSSGKINEMGNVQVEEWIWNLHIA
ncbi:uncharacterized protein LOC131598073 [Vicia villosa]|uniref:uncharacterized protein LOC131598073 n=1 Tax=Vicia villosa TaxID=3911 RepID=UPI00273AEC27|nr:uncharacterized protein LOC131598073 [Vicia villosa]